MKTKTYLLIIFIQALIAMLGSLYYSHFGDPVTNLIIADLFPENAGLAPCKLCYVARILMYPMVLLSAIAYIYNDRGVFKYLIGLSGLGILLDTYHYVLQKAAIPNPFGCTLANPCDALNVDYFGFITIPFLALVAFIVIFILSLVALKKTK